MEKSIKILKSLQHDNGLFKAASCGETGYDKCWIRDTLYALLGLEAAKEMDSVVKGLHTLFDIFLKHEYKIDWAVKEKPQHKHQYIHARYDAKTYEEFHEDWGNKQNDAIGAFLWKVGDLERKGVKVLRGDNDSRILQKLVMYLASIEYWHDKDNGMWENDEEVHASSVGACVAGLLRVKGIVDVPNWLVNAGKETLWMLLPAESCSKKVDLALLSLIYPYDVVDLAMKQKILSNVEEYLVREKGLIRYSGDWYYNEEGEAEWTMGFAWLSIIYRSFGDAHKSGYYLDKVKEAAMPNGEMPELYHAKSKMPNRNSPLAWAQSLRIVAEAP